MAHPPEEEFARSREQGAMKRVSAAAFRRRLEAGGMDRLDCLPRGVTGEFLVAFSSAPGRRLLADAFYPEDRPGGARPGMVFVHGGGWRQGSREQFARQAAWLALEHGIVSVCCEYRLSHESAFPACLQDVKCAVRWLRSRAKELGVDPERIGIAGGSAGGHLAAMVATTAGVAEYEGEGGHAEFSSDVSLCVPHNGVFDLAERARTWSDPGSPVEALIGGALAEMPEAYREASPLARATAGAAPFLLMHGGADELIPCGQSQAMHERLMELGVHSELEVFPGVGHGWFNSAPHFWPVLERMRRFIVERFAL